MASFGIGTDMLLGLNDELVRQASQPLMNQMVSPLVAPTTDKRKKKDRNLTIQDLQKQVELVLGNQNPFVNVFATPEWRGLAAAGGPTPAEVGAGGSWYIPWTGSGGAVGGGGTGGGFGGGR